MKSRNRIVQTLDGYYPHQLPHTFDVFGTAHNNSHREHFSTSTGIHAAASALPANYLVTGPSGNTYEIGKGMTLPSGYDYNRYGLTATDWSAWQLDDGRGLPQRVNQAILLRAHAGGSGIGNIAQQTVTIELLPSQQDRYLSLNMLHFSHDYLSNAGNYDGMTHSIRVKYQGDADFTLIYTANAAFTEAQLAQAWQNTARDGNTYSIAHTSAQYWSRTGSSGNYSSVIATANRYLWEFTEDLALDGNKVLEQVQIHVYSQRLVTGNAAHGVSIFGINVTPIPEPGTVGLALGGLALVVLRRRSRG